MFVTERERQIEVLDRADVLVAGGGVAGCNAAIAAARAGAKTVLIERNGCLGGILTSNIIPNICNHFMDVEGRHRVYGIAREMIERLVERDACVKDWEKPFAKIVIDEQVFKVLLIEMLEEAGVQILTHALGARPIMEGNAVRGAFVETKAGRMAVLAGTVVDCTGEADLAYQTGCPMRWSSGTVTTAFKMANVDTEAFYRHFEERPQAFPLYHDAIRGFGDFQVNWKEYGDLYFPHRGGRRWDVFQDAIAKGEYAKRRGEVFGLDMCCLIGLKPLRDVSVNSMFMRLNSLDPREVAHAETECQKACYYVADFMRSHVPGFQNAHLVQISQDMGIRVSRGLDGEKTVTWQHMTSPEPAYCDDVIGCASGVPWRGDGALDHPFDKDEDVGGKTIVGHSEVNASGTFYYAHTVDIPFGIMVPKGVENLLVGSGKTLSANPQPLLRTGISSMIPGQAAGVAAALAAKAALPVREVNIRQVQRTLLEQGVFLGDETRLAALGLS